MKCISENVIPLPEPFDGLQRLRIVIGIHEAACRHVSCLPCGSQSCAALALCPSLLLLQPPDCPSVPQTRQVLFQFRPLYKVFSLPGNYLILPTPYSLISAKFLESSSQISQFENVPLLLPSVTSCSWFIPSTAVYESQHLVSASLKILDNLVWWHLIVTLVCIS